MLVLGSKCCARQVACCCCYLYLHPSLCAQQEENKDEDEEGPVEPKKKETSIHSHRRQVVTAGGTEGVAVERRMGSLQLEQMWGKREGRQKANGVKEVKVQGRMPWMPPLLMPTLRMWRILYFRDDGKLYDSESFIVPLLYAVAMPSLKFLLAQIFLLSCMSESVLCMSSCTQAKSTRFIMPRRNTNCSNEQVFVWENWYNWESRRLMGMWTSPLRSMWTLIACFYQISIMRLLWGAYAHIQLALVNLSATVASGAHRQPPCPRHERGVVRYIVWQISNGMRYETSVIYSEEGRRGNGVLWTGDGQRRSVVCKD